MINGFVGPYQFLSNFALDCPAEFEGVIYPTSEHAYQAAKSLIPEERERIRRCSTPNKAKQAGKPGKLTLRPDWDSIKNDIMYQIVKSKFQNPRLAEKLLATGDKELIELNWWSDCWWGVCKGVGHNHLGKILMRVRAELLENIALEKDATMYLECLNNKPLKDRKTPEEVRDGLILFHHVYKHIRK